MGLFEFVPLVMIDVAVLVHIERVEHFRFGIVEVSVEFIPIHKVIAVGIDIAKMRIERFRVRQGSFMTRISGCATGGQCDQDDWNRDK
jgi:hypothetical protein